jgi:hypothetical protein
MSRRVPLAVLLAALGLGVPAGADQENLITNGDFSSGIAGWSYFDNPPGTGEWQVSDDGVFEWNLPGDQTSLSVIYQVTGMAVRGAPLGAQFDLGNSSRSRKRVTVLLLDADFSDITACRFTVEPGSPLRTYRMRIPARRPWTNAALYFYANSTGNAAATGGHLQLDNVSVHRTMASGMPATECVEPADSGLLEETMPPASPPGPALFREPAQVARLNFDDLSSGEWISGADGAGTRLLRWRRPVDVDASAGSKLTFVSSVEGGAGSAEVQVSLDGVNWRTLARIPPEETMTEVQVDLSAFAGHRLFVQFAFTPLLGESAVWRVTDVRVSRRD